MGGGLVLDLRGQISAGTGGLVTVHMAGLGDREQALTGGNTTITLGEPTRGPLA
jgi:hypothetical protein